MVPTCPGAWDTLAPWKSLGGESPGRRQLPMEGGHPLGLHYAAQSKVIASVSPVPDMNPTLW